MNKWVKNLLIKVVKTMSQSAIAVIGSTALITEVDWTVVASTVALSGVLCVLMNLAQLETDDEVE